MRTLLDILLWPFFKWQERRATKKRMEALRKSDPFIYK